MSEKYVCFFLNSFCRICSPSLHRCTTEDIHIHLAHHHTLRWSKIQKIKTSNTNHPNGWYQLLWKYTHCVEGTFTLPSVATVLFSLFYRILEHDILFLTYSFLKCKKNSFSLVHELFSTVAHPLETCQCFLRQWGGMKNKSNVLH